MKEHHGHALIGLRTREYRIWGNMKQRCSNPNSSSYQWYGGKGISVCDEWARSFAAFLRDMGPCPKAFTIDRKDTSGDYTPSNCRWASQSEQQSNRSNNVLIEYCGETLNATQWAHKTGIPAYLILQRAKRGLPPAKILFPRRLGTGTVLASRRAK